MMTMSMKQLFPLKSISTNSQNNSAFILEEISSRILLKERPFSTTSTEPLSLFFFNVQVAVNCRHFCEYKHRVHRVLTNTLHIKGDLSLDSVEFRNVGNYPWTANKAIESLHQFNINKLVSRCLSGITEHLHQTNPSNLLSIPLTDGTDYFGLKWDPEHGRSCPTARPSQTRSIQVTDFFFDSYFSNLTCCFLPSLLHSFSVHVRI